MSVSGPSTTPLLTAFDHRRSCYNLSNGSTIPEGELKQLIKDCLNVVPSAFNTQTTRLVLLVGQHHTRLWEIIGSSLRAKIGDERYAAGTEARIKGFTAAYATILFCDDPKAVEGLKLKGGDLYGPKAEEWTHQSNGMHQYFMWTAIESYPGMGVNLQHYNPLIDAAVIKEWQLPEHWVLKAQMVLGQVQNGTSLGDRTARSPAEDRMVVFEDWVEE